MRVLPVVAMLVLVPTGVRADEAPTPPPPPPIVDEPSPLLLAYLRSARDAATAGHCDMVHQIGESVRNLDGRFHAYTFSTDPLVERCSSNAPSTIAPLEPGGPATVFAGQPPPLSGARVVGEVALGALAGGLGATIGFFGGASVCVDDGGEFECLGSALIGGYALGTFGVALGVYAVGSSGDQNGSFGATVGGAFLGAVLGVALVAATSEDVAAVGLIGGPFVGAIVGFNMTRRYDRGSVPFPTGSLLRLDDGRVSLGIPLVMRTEHATNVSLFSGSF